MLHKTTEKKYLTRDQALLKLQRYCAYQDRCHQEVRSKLIDLGVYGDDLENVIVDLIQDNFLNEERFARSFARGKFRIKSWGRDRIRRELKQRRISAYCIKKAMTEISDEDYDATLRAEIARRQRLIRGKTAFERRGMLAKYLIGRGFETGLVWELLEEK